MSHLQMLHLAGNRLTGAIPRELGDLSSLQDLYLYGNQLSGPIPLSLTELGELRSLYLGGNRLTGEIPPELGNLPNLRSLSLERNQLTGTIPTSLGSLPNLWALILNGNQLTGPIPAELGSATALVTLILSGNQLTGAIPSELGSLTALQALQLRSNALDGPVPMSLTALASLHSLDIRWNALDASDPTLAAFLDALAPGWQNTQTVPPTRLATTATTATSVTVTWRPIAYTADTGGYRVCYSPGASGDEVTCQTETTPSKSSLQAVVTGLEPATAYSFVVLTETAPHADNANRVVSGPSAALTATTAAAEPVRFAVATLAVSEAAASATITVTRPSGATAGLLVDYATADGTALAPADYLATSGTLTFAAGQLRRTFTVPIVRDTLAEGRETLQLVLSNARCGGALAAPSTATLVIADDDVAGTVVLRPVALSVSEGAGTATVTVRRAGGRASGVTVDYATADGTAEAGSDYTAATGTLSFGAGQAVATFEIPITDDAVGENNETVQVVLSNPTGGATLGAARAVVTILENEHTIQLTQASVGVTEGGVLTVAVRRSGNLAGRLTVDYATADGTALAGADYQARQGTLTFGPGINLRRLTLATVGDTLPEASESFVLRLLNPAGGVLGPTVESAVTILDND